MKHVFSMKYKFQHTLVHGEFHVSEFFNRIEPIAEVRVAALHEAAATQSGHRTFGRNRAVFGDALSGH